MTTLQDLFHMLDLNDYTLKRQLAGITHEESLKQLPFRANCLNWVLGHIVEARNYTLEILGEERVWSEKACEPYASGSMPIVLAEDRHYHWNKIMADAAESQARIRAKLATLTEAELNTDIGKDITLRQQLVQMFWHEAYHAGQTEILRQLAGKNDHAL